MEARLTRLLLTGALLLLIAQTSAAAPTKRRVLFVLDASGSMSLPFNGISRMSAARRMLQEQMRQLPDAVPVGLIAYGNGVLGCRSTRVYQSIEPYSGRKISRIVDNMLAAGNTPLAYTLRSIRTKLLPLHPNLTVIVMSDGVESCGGDPIAEARLMRSQGAVVHVIGLGTSPRVSLQLRAIARAGRGSYRTVENDRQFRQAFEGPLSDLRRRRNYFIARKWGIHDRQETRRRSDSEFVITAVRRGTPRAGSLPVEVDFRFRQNPGDDFFVQIRAIPSPSNPQSHVRVPQDESTIAAVGEAFHGTLNGTGTARLEIPYSVLRNGPIYLQGELWRTGGVPSASALSNSLRLQ